MLACALYVLQNAPPRLLRCLWRRLLLSTPTLAREPSADRFDEPADDDVALAMVGGWVSSLSLSQTHTLTLDGGWVGGGCTRA